MLRQEKGGKNCGSVFSDSVCVCVCVLASAVCSSKTDSRFALGLCFSAVNHVRPQRETSDPWRMRSFTPPYNPNTRDVPGRPGSHQNMFNVGHIWVWSSVRSSLESPHYWQFGQKLLIKGIVRPKYVNSVILKLIQTCMSFCWRSFEEYGYQTTL